MGRVEGFARDYLSHSLPPTFGVPACMHTMKVKATSVCPNYFRYWNSNGSLTFSN